MLKKKNPTQNPTNQRNSNTNTEIDLICNYSLEEEPPRNLGVFSDDFYFPKSEHSASNISKLLGAASGSDHLSRNAMIYIILEGKWLRKNVSSERY